MRFSSLLCVGTVCDIYIIANTTKWWFCNTPPPPNTLEEIHFPRILLRYITTHKGYYHHYYFFSIFFIFYSVHERDILASFVTKSISILFIRTYCMLVYWPSLYPQNIVL